MIAVRVKDCEVGWVELKYMKGDLKGCYENSRIKAQ